MYLNSTFSSLSVWRLQCKRVVLLCRVPECTMGLSLCYFNLIRACCHSLSQYTKSCQYILLDIFFSAMRKRERHSFGTTWRWLNNDRIFTFLWTIPIDLSDHLYVESSPSHNSTEHVSLRLSHAATDYLSKKQSRKDGGLRLCWQHLCSSKVVVVFCWLWAMQNLPRGPRPGRCDVMLL